jgi:hypothetical protein
MPKKLTYGFVKSSFEKKDYKLLTKVYKNAYQKLNYICPKGHKHSISWSGWQQGKRCPYCVGQGKLTIQFIKKEFRKENYKLLTKVYENNKQKLKYICPNGHKHFIRWSDWNRFEKCRCPYCAKRPPINIDFVRKEFKKENYELLTKSYKGNK